MLCVMISRQRLADRIGAALFLAALIGALNLELAEGFCIALEKRREPLNLLFSNSHLTRSEKEAGAIGPGATKSERNVFASGNGFLRRFRIVNGGADRAFLDALAQVAGLQVNVRAIRQVHRVAVPRDCKPEP